MKKISRIFAPIGCVLIVPTNVTPFIVGCSEHYEVKDWVDDSNIQLISEYTDIKDEEANRWTTIVEMPGFIYKGTEKTFDEFMTKASVTKITIFDPDGNLLPYETNATLYKTGVDNEFGIKFAIHDNGGLRAYIGEYDKHKYVISELQIKMSKMYVYKKKNALNFCISRTDFRRRSEGLTFQLTDQQHKFIIDGYEYLHYPPQFTRIEAAMFKWNGTQYVEIDKSETDVVIFTYYEAQHQIQISFNPSVAVWPFDFFIGFYGIKKDESKELVDTISDLEYHVTNQWFTRKKIGFSTMDPPKIYGGFLYKDWYHDPYSLTNYYFFLNEANGDWNYIDEKGTKHEVPYIIFTMYSTDLSFHTNFSRVKFELYDRTTLREQLEKDKDYVWYHDEFSSEIHFTETGKQKILSGITDNLIFVASDFRLEKIHYMKPWGHCSPFFRGVTNF